MIDIEQDILLAVREAVIAEFPRAGVYSSEERTPAKFPFVSVVEADNSTRQDTADSGSNERHVNVMYQIDCYSNAKHGRKTECKRLFALADGVMLRAGFARTMTRPVNMDQATAYRITARYTASVDEQHTIYRR